MDLEVPVVIRRSLIPPNLRKLRFVGIRDDRLFRGTLRCDERLASAAGGKNNPMIFSPVGA
jgi:hypothetical protein